MRITLDSVLGWHFNNAENVASDLNIAKEKLRDTIDRSIVALDASQDYWEGSSANSLRTMLRQYLVDNRSGAVFLEFLADTIVEFKNDAAPRVKSIIELCDEVSRQPFSLKVANDGVVYSLKADSELAREPLFHLAQKDGIDLLHEMYSITGRLTGAIQAELVAIEGIDDDYEKKISDWIQNWLGEDTPEEPGSPGVLVSFATRAQQSVDRAMPSTMAPHI